MDERPKTKSANELGETGRCVAQNLARIRNAKGISTLKLAAILNESGRRITASAISKIEGGARRVDADDLVAFAVALNVNPSALLLPHVVTGNIEVSTAGHVSARRAWDWADGLGPLLHADDESVRVAFQLHARPSGRRSA